MFGTKKSVSDQLLFYKSFFIFHHYFSNILNGFLHNTSSAYDLTAPCMLVTFILCPGRSLRSSILLPFCTPVFIGPFLFSCRASTSLLWWHPDVKFFSGSCTTDRHRSSSFSTFILFCCCSPCNFAPDKHVSRMLWIKINQGVFCYVTLHAIFQWSTFFYSLWSITGMYEDLMWKETSGHWADS